MKKKIQKSRIGAFYKTTGLASSKSQKHGKGCVCLCVCARVHMHTRMPSYSRLLKEKEDIIQLTLERCRVPIPAHSKIHIQLLTPS